MESIDSIHMALDSTLEALVAHRECRRASQKEQAIDPSIFRFGNSLTEDRIPTREESWLALLRSNPIEASLHRTIAILGQKLNDHGGIDQMRDSLEIVASMRSGRQYGLRNSICDSKWNGIGGWWG